LRLVKKVSGFASSPNIKASYTSDLVPSVQLSDDGIASTIMGQIVQNGLAKGSPIPMSGPDPLFRKLPSVALDAAGNFLVVWEEENDSGTDDIVAARFDSKLTPLGSLVVLNDTLDGQQAEPWASGDDSGDMVVVWTSYNEDDTIAGDIYGKELDGFGDAIGSEFLVSTDTSGNQFMPQVQMDGDGGFVVAWTQEPTGDSPDVAPPDPSSLESSLEWVETAAKDKPNGVYYRVYGSDGRPRGLERRVQDGSGGRARLSKLEVHRHGGFKIRWRELDANGRDLGEREREHDRDGNPAGGR